MKVLRYEDSLAGLTDVDGPTVFMAGPTVRGNQPHLTSWRFDAIEEFRRLGFEGMLIVPEFTEKTESDKNKLWIPRWEFAGLTGCDVILFWIPRTKELIGLTTNHEHGYWLGKMSDKMIYGRPDDGYRNTYLDIMWEVENQQCGSPVPWIFNNLPGTVEASILSATFFQRKFRRKSKIAVDSPYGAF